MDRHRRHRRIVAVKRCVKINQIRGRWSVLRSAIHKFPTPSNKRTLLLMAGEHNEGQVGPRGSTQRVWRLWLHAGSAGTWPPPSYPGDCFNQFCWQFLFIFGGASC